MHAGRVEFTSFLPENTQAAIIQPIGSEGVLIAASNTQRGFTRLDQVHPSAFIVLAHFLKIANTQGFANWCIVGNIYVRSNLSRERTEFTAHLELCMYILHPAENDGCSCCRPGRRPLLTNWTHR